LNTHLAELPVGSRVGLSWLIPANDQLRVENEESPENDNAEKREN
jgi:hypothetical protein